MGLLTGAIWVLVPVAGAIGLFTFLAVATWAEARRSEREAYYKYEFRKRLVDSGKLDAKELESLIHQEANIASERSRAGLLAGGLIVAGAGMGLLAGLQFIEDEAVWMVGFIPLGIGVGMLLYALLVGARTPTSPGGGPR